jgi:hypothetical protein
MRALIAAVATISIVVLVITSAASAFEGGGRKPSEAPTIAWGQHYSGELTNHEDDANWEPNSYSAKEVAFYRLPPVGVRDQIVVNWQSVPFTRGSGFPVCLQFVQGANDFNWASSPMFNYGSCSSPNGAQLSGSGTAATSLTIQATDSSNTYLEFISRANQDEPSYYEAFPYSLSVEGPRHFLGLALVPKSKVHANGAIGGAVTLADGTPAPDGLPFSLSVTWENNGIASYAATTVGGRVTFPLSLPESAFHQHAVFLVSHGADATYQGVTGRLAANVTPPVASAAEIACEKARQHAQTLSRQYARLKSHARFARGATRRRLHRRASRVGRELRAARAGVGRLCGPS